MLHPLTSYSCMVWEVIFETRGVRIMIRASFGLSFGCRESLRYSMLEYSALDTMPIMEPAQEELPISMILLRNCFAK